MQKIILSKEQARQFALDCFDTIMRDIKAEKDRQQEEITKTKGDERDEY